MTKQWNGGQRADIDWISESKVIFSLEFDVFFWHWPRGRPDIVAVTGLPGRISNKIKPAPHTLTETSSRNGTDLQTNWRWQCLLEGRGRYLDQ